MTSQDLGYKLGVLEQAKFEYSPMCKVFNKGLEEDDKKEGILKRLKNIEDKNEEKPEVIKEQKSIAKQELRS